ncbi:MAG: response regulator transcription factor, partial [Acidobacteria bacterium]|nr:response regulator transcription factor [Acidobacteriota bacterium]
MSFRIFVADDHEVVRRGLCALLQAQPDWEVCGEAADGREALDLIRAHKPDVVLMDISMPRLNGLEATRLSAKEFPETRVVILSMHTDREYVRQALAAGAVGYVLKSATQTDLVTALETANRGDVWLS